MAIQLLTHNRFGEVVSCALISSLESNFYTPLESFQFLIGYGEMVNPSKENYAHKSSVSGETSIL